MAVQLFNKIRHKKTRLVIILLVTVIVMLSVADNDKTVAETYTITLEANLTTVERGENVTLSAQVMYGDFPADVSVDFYDETASTFLGSDNTENGWAEVIYTMPSNASLGDHVFRAEISGAPEYNDTTTVRVVIGTISVRLEITPDIQIKGSSVELKANVTNNDSPLQDTRVDFFDETDNFPIGNATTDSQGEAVFIWQILPDRSVGTHQISATASKQGYEDGSDSATVEILDPLTIDLEMSKTELDRGETVVLNATVTDSSTSEAEVGAMVKFYDDDVLIGNTTTNDQGIAIFDYDTPIDASYGEHEIRATVYEDDSRFSEVTESLTIYMNAAIDATLSTSTVTREDSITVTVYVTDEQENGVLDFTVELYDATIDQVVANGTTDETGYVEFVYGIPIDSPVGEHTLVVRLTEVSQYVKFSESQHVLEVYADTDLHVELLVTDAETGDTVEIEATLTDNALNGLEGYTIFFYAGDTLLGSTTTNVNGSAVFQWSVDSSVLGQQQIRAEFVASGYYHSSISNTETINIHSNYIEILNDLTVESGEGHNVKVRVIEDGEPQPDVTVKLYVEVDGNWVLVDEEQTNDDGEASLSMTVQDELGSQKIKIWTEQKTKTETLRVKYEPDIDVDIDTGLELGDELDINVTIKDYNGDPIQVKVSIYFDGELLKSETTDEDGSIETSITPDEIGEYEVRIKFGSISDAIVETIKKTVRVGEPINIEYEKNPTVNGANSSISVTLQQNETGMANVSIDVYLEKQDTTNSSVLTLGVYTQDVYYTTIQTNEDGIATFSMAEFEDGDYTIRMIFYRSDIKESVEIEIQVTVEHQAVGNFPLMVTNIPGTPLLFSAMSVLGICIAIGGLMYYFFIRTPQPFDPLSSLSEPQSNYEGQGEEQMGKEDLTYELPSFWTNSDMINPQNYGVKSIFVIAFDHIIGPVVKECRVFNADTEFINVVMNPTKLTSFYTMAVTRDQFKLEEHDENIFVRMATVSTKDTDSNIQGDIVAQHILVIVTEKGEYDEKFVNHLSKTFLVEWPDQQGYLAHKMDQFVPNIEVNIPTLL